MSKKQMLKQKKKYDVLLSTDASDAQGFLVEGGDDHAMVLYTDEEDGNEDVMSCMGLPWSLIGETTRDSEKHQLRRSARVRDLEEEQFEYDEDAMKVDEDEEWSSDSFHDHGIMHSCHQFIMHVSFVLYEGVTQ